MYGLEFFNLWYVCVLFQVSDGRRDTDIRNRKKDADDEDNQQFTVSFFHSISVLHNISGVYAFSDLKSQLVWQTHCHFQNLVEMSKSAATSWENHWSNFDKLNISAEFLAIVVGEWKFWQNGIAYWCMNAIFLTLEQGQKLWLLQDDNTQWRLKNV